MHRFSATDRRARVVRRHLLDPGARASSVAEVADALVAIHSTDPVTVFLSVLARTDGLGVDAIARELYDERSVVRMLGMRRTLFVVPRELRPIVQAACTDAIARRERTRLLGWIDGAPGTGDAAELLRRAERAALDAVADAGEASATAELVRATPVLATKIVLGSGRWALEASLGSRVLPMLAAQGRLVRGRPRGTWISGQYRWTLPERWLGDVPAPAEPEEARTVLVRRWLASYGPGTEVDLRWWTGLGARPVRAALVAVGAVEVDLDGTTGYALPDDLDAVEASGPSAALLATLDSTTMGWKERAWLLGEHERILFDRNGNAGPTVWWEGRVVGGWAQRANGEIAYRVLEDVGAAADAAIAAEAERLADWLGDVRFKPGFLPPFQRELAT